MPNDSCDHFRDATEMVLKTGVKIRKIRGYKMSTNAFLNEFNELVGEGFHEDACNMIINLGAKAKFMLEIGILQDELIELGFKPINHHMYQYDDVLKNGKWIWLDFTIGYMYHNNRDTQIDLTNPKNVLTKIKELINETN